MGPAEFEPLTVSTYMLLMKEDEFHPRIIAKGFYLEQTVELLHSTVRS